MADDFTDDSIAVEDAPDFSTESVAVEPLPSPSHPPAIRDEPLPAEDTYVSHLALPLSLRPLPPITSERLTVPEPSGPSVFERFNRLGQPVYDTPTEPTVDVFSQRDKSLIEDAQSRMVLKDRIEKMGSPVSTGLRESAVSGIQGLASNTGLAAAAGVAVAPQLAVPALFAVTVPQVPEVIERIQKAREEGDRPAYYRAVGDALQTFAVLGVTLPSTLRLPRSLDAWRESVGARAEARFQAAKDITPRPPLQLPERFVEPPLPEIRIRTTGGPANAIQIKGSEKPVPSMPPQPAVSEDEVPVEIRSEGVRASPQAAPEGQISLTVPDYDPTDIGARERIKRRQDQGQTREQAVAADAADIKATRDWVENNTNEGDVIQTPDGRIYRRDFNGKWYDVRDGKQAGSRMGDDSGLRGGKIIKRGTKLRTSDDAVIDAETPKPAAVPLTDPVGNSPEFYSLPRLRALDRSKDPRLAAAKKYYGAKTIPDLARLAKARFDEMAAKAKPLETREDAEMKRVQALPEGPEGEAQLVAEDIAKAVEMVDVSDIAGVSPVPALVRLIRRAARDPAMKTAAEQAMQKIGAAAREQGVPLDTIKQEIAGELKAIYGADAAEMAKAFFGEETKPALPAPAEPPIPPGPGAASPSEFAERTAKGAGAQPPTPPPSATIDASATPSPEIARRAKDFNIFNKANSGQWTFYFGKLGEAAKSAWDKMTLSAFKIREDIGRDVQRYADNLLSRLPRPIRKNGGRVFFDALDGKPLDQIEAEWRGRPHGDAVIAAAGEIKTRLEEIRTTIRDAKREAYHGFLMGLDRPTLAQLFDNNISRAVDTSKYPKEMFADALTRNEFPDDWGIADGSYLTHLFTGDWKVSVSRGETTEFVTRAKTVAEAKIRVREYVRNNPDYANADWKIEQDTVIPADMIRLGDRRFWQLVQQMKDNLGVSASEIKQAQQGIIGRKASKQKWFGSLQQRRGFQGYSHDYRQVITAYLSGFHRWLELTKLQREVQPLIEQVRREGRTSAAEQLDILMDNLWGKPAQSTVLFDNFIREVPGVRDYIKPLALERWSRNIRSTLAFLTLKTGRFAVVNRLQPLQGLYPLVGERIMAQAKIRQHTAEGRALLDEAGVRFDPGQYGGEATGVKSTLRNIGERISGERSNQELAFLAMFQHGIESGLSRAEAINYAKLRGQLLTQFTPVITDIPPIMRGPITGLLFQFKRFPIKQAELLFKMVAQRQFGGLARWLGVMAAAGGLSYFMRQFLFPSDKRERLRRSITQQHGQVVADAVMYGAPGLMNVDLSGSLVLGEEPFGANIYEKVGRQVTGPAVSLTAEGIKAALTEPRESTTALQKAITMLRRFPTLKPIAELIALEQSDLDVRTPDGEVKYRKAVNDAVVGIGAFRTANEANMQSAVNAIVELKRQTTELKNAAYVAAISNGNIEPALEAIQKFNERWPEVAISSKELNEYIHTRAKASGKTDYERQAGKKFAPLLPEQP